MSLSAWLRLSSFSSQVSARAFRSHPHHLHSSRTMPGAHSSSVGPPTTGSPASRFSAVSERFPTVGTGHVPGGFQDLEREIRLHATDSQHEPSEGHRVVVATALWWDMAR